MYTLKIMLRHPDSYEDSRWCASHTFNTIGKCVNYLEKNYYSSLEDPDGQYKFEVYDSKGNVLY